jgi:hypothetical protein
MTPLGENAETPMILRLICQLRCPLAYRGAEDKAARIRFQITDCANAEPPEPPPRHVAGI